MQKATKKIYKHRKNYRKLGPDCECGNKSIEITHLGLYFDVLSIFFEKDKTFWFRGNANLEWRLIPSALRSTSLSKRDKALNLLNDFKRFGEMKIPKPPNVDEEFKWIQIAQHYGLPTRLLDWTNPTFADRH